MAATAKDDGAGGRDTIPIGVIFSVTGSYATVGQEMLNGTLLALEEINADPRLGITLAPVIGDPGGNLARYADLCADILKQGVRHVIGCYTSSSRKEIIPVIEKNDALLWYPSHYEGFESSPNVIYTGASPNQHIVPLCAYLLREYGRRAYCIGSNYIWAWENNRILREIVTGYGGEVCAERYLAVGAMDVERIVADIRRLRPDFIFNTLIGETSYAFFRAVHAAGATDDWFGTQACPIASCSLSEPELTAIGAPACAGHLASSVYFQSIRSPANDTFVARYRTRHGDDRPTSADAEASYIAGILLGRSLAAAATDTIDPVKEALYDLTLDAPQGPVRVDRDNNHCFLTPRLGRSTSGGQFSIFATASQPVRPDPYLVWFDARDMGRDLNRVLNGSGSTLKVIK